MATSRAALLIGLNYGGTAPEAELKGSFRDVEALRSVLVAARRFDASQITVLTDADDAGREVLTERRLRRELLVLARRTHSERMDAVYVHFSGHGQQVPDENTDENDGLDECLLCRDFQTGGMITDDWLSRWLTHVRPGTRVLFTVDACHSGSCLDIIKAGRRVVYMSGCMDKQTAAEANGGVFTTALVEVLATRKGAWDDLRGTYADVAALVVGRFGLPQAPVLLTSAPYDADDDAILGPI